MPFAWSARPLFKLYGCELDLSTDSMTLYRQDTSKLGDDDILKILMDYRKYVCFYHILDNIVKE